MENINKKLELLKSIEAFDLVMMNKVLPYQGIVSTNGNFGATTREWFLVAQDMAKLVERDYLELYGEEKTFQEIYAEVTLWKQSSFGKVEYPEDTQMKL